MKFVMFDFLVGIVAIAVPSVLIHFKPIEILQEPVDQDDVLNFGFELLYLETQFYNLTKRLGLIIRDGTNSTIISGYLTSGSADESILKFEMSLEYVENEFYNLIDTFGQSVSQDTNDLLTAGFLKGGSPQETLQNFALRIKYLESEFNNLTKTLGHTDDGIENGKLNSENTVDL